MCKGSSACEAPRAEAGERVGRHLRKGPECQAELSSSVCRGQWGAREEFRAERGRASSGQDYGTRVQGKK